MNTYEYLRKNNVRFQQHMMRIIREINNLYGNTVDSSLQDHPEITRIEVIKDSNPSFAEAHCHVKGTLMEIYY